ncbi:MAG: hypothetical protein ACYC1C_17655 [Chloroflexota bacterium]
MQNMIGALARNPMALKALLDTISPVMRNMIKQETTGDFAKLRQDVDNITNALSNDLPVVIGNLNNWQRDTAAGVDQLREEVAALRQAQEAREATLQAELQSIREELAAVVEELRRVQEATGVRPASRRRWPWQG